MLVQRNISSEIQPFIAVKRDDIQNQTSDTGLREPEQQKDKTKDNGKYIQKVILDILKH